MISNSKILIIASHPDDEVLGCGGMISRYSKKCEINVLFLSDGISSRERDNKKIKLRRNQSIKVSKILNFKILANGNFPDNQFDSVSTLEIAKFIEKHTQKIKPDYIFTHHLEDMNVDHQIASRATLIAHRTFKSSSKGIFFYETISNTEQYSSVLNKAFIPNIYINIKNHLKSKINAMKIYSEEFEKYPHPRSKEFIKTLAEYRGLCSGNQLAEAYHLFRLNI